MLFCTLLSVGLLVASLGYIAHTFWQYRESEQYYESVRDEYLNDGESVPLTDSKKIRQRMKAVYRKIFRQRMRWKPASLYHTLREM